MTPAQPMLSAETAPPAPPGLTSHCGAALLLVRDVRRTTPSWGTHDRYGPLPAVPLRGSVVERGAHRAKLRGARGMSPSVASMQ